MTQEKAQEKALTSEELRKKILGMDDLTVEKVWVPQWKTNVYVRAMSGLDRKNFEKGNTKIDEEENEVFDSEKVREALLVNTLCSDSEGKNLIFKPEDVDALGNKSFKALHKCVEVTMRLNGVQNLEEDEEEKNS